MSDVQDSDSRCIRPLFGRGLSLCFCISLYSSVSASLSVCLSVSLSGSLSLSVSVSLCLSFFVSLSVCLYMSLSIYLSVMCLFHYLFCLPLLVCQFHFVYISDLLRLPVRLSFCLCVCTVGCLPTSFSVCLLSCQCVSVLVGTFLFQNSRRSMVMIQLKSATLSALQRFLIHFSPLEGFTS